MSACLPLTIRGRYVAAKWVATAKMGCHSMCNVPVCTLGVAVHCTGVFRHIGRKPTVVVRC